MNWPSTCSRVWLMRIVSLVMWSWTAPLSGAASSVLSTSKACAKYREGRESGDLSAQRARRGPVAGKPLPAGGCRLPPDEVACGQSGNDFRPSRRLAEKRRPLSLALRSSRGPWPIAAKSQASPLQQLINDEPGGGFRYPCALTKRGIPHARCHHLTRPVRRHLGRRDVFRLHGAAAGGGHSAGAAAAARAVGAAVATLLVSGYGMLFRFYGDMAHTPIYVHVMQALGLMMMLIFAHVVFTYFRRLKQAVAAEDWKSGAMQLAQIRRWIGMNLILGLLVVSAASGGRLVM